MKCAEGGDRVTCAYHDMGGEGDPYPLLLRVLTTACGVYAIRDKATKKILYVGSSKNTLYSTATRHFQSWKRRNNWHSGKGGGKSHDPGVVYKRARIEMMIEVLPKGSDYLKREAELIHKLSPADNLTRNPDGVDRDEEVIPF